jgi:hypothetical protein
MVGRNVLGLQPVGEHLHEKIRSLFVFCVIFIYTMYLIISDICIFNVPDCWLFVCAWNIVYLFYVVAWILITTCGSFMLVFRLYVVRIQDPFRELSIGTAWCPVC